MRTAREHRDLRRASALLAIAVMGWGAAGAPAGAQTPAPTEVPRGLADALLALDRTLETDRMGAQQADKEQVRFYARAGEDALRTVENAYFVTTRIDGLPASEVIDAFTCVDEHLVDARWQAVTLFAAGQLKNPKHPATAQRIAVIEHFDEAHRCATALVESLQRVKTARRRTIRRLAALRDAVARGRRTAARAGGIAIADDAERLAAQKQRIIDQDFRGPVDGVAGSTVIKAFDCIRSQLTDVRYAGGDHRAVNQDFLQAIRCKEGLERAVRKEIGSRGPVTWGSPSLDRADEVIDNATADVEYWWQALAGSSLGAPRQAPGTPAAHVTVTPTAPVAGRITSITVKGHAVSGDRPGPGGSEPIRFQVLRPQPGGQLKVITTTNPAFTLPGADGIYTYDLAAVPFAVRVQAGDYVSLAARGGQLSVFAAVPGSQTDSVVMGGAAQDPGTLYTPNHAFAGAELLMQVTEQPSP